MVNENIEYSSYPVFGKASSCDGLDEGRLNIDLTGTGFYIPDSVIWSPYWFNSFMTILERTNKRVSAVCTGNCGGCIPTQESWFMTPEEQVIDIRYDHELDPTACIPVTVIDFTTTQPAPQDVVETSISSTAPAFPVGPGPVFGSN